MFKTCTIKINIAKHGDKICQNYLGIRDIYVSAMLLGMAIYSKTHDVDVSTMSFEGLSDKELALFNQAFAMSNLKDVLSTVEVKHIHAYLDIAPYIDEFLGKHHREDCSNIYHLTIDGNYDLVITNKRFNVGKVYVF